MKEMDKSFSISDEALHQGDFTLPGESGYEALTLELAQKWGADVIRDSDGTKLSDDIVKAGYRIYSTICIIRQHNAFAEAHPDAQQECFLSSKPVMALSSSVSIQLMDGYFREQFELNTSPESIAYWQVWDRTENALVDASAWKFRDGTVEIEGAKPYHLYTVSFLCWRIWEEINMYNHTTNNWTSEHLRQLDPRHPLAWAYLKEWLNDWCVKNPDTNVVRLTSLFYNFVWIFGDDERRKSMFTDWASYDFTVSPAALKAFEEQYGYAMTAEDFIQKGHLQPTHLPPTDHKRDWMQFIQKFVAEKAKELVEIIHAHGKQAYVFYDDSWVGLEPYGEFFSKVGFDGLIKCIFSGFECRLCAGAEVPTHEIRLHPYLFPVGLGGAPTFMEGGHPEKDAMEYWLHARRALLRQSVDRIGLGGYLHLTQGFPAFNDTIEQIGKEFRLIKALHKEGAPVTCPVKVAVLHTWGSLRSWTLSGHFHETFMHTLIHVNEALSGLPVDVKFVSFEDMGNGALKDVQVVINAGRAGDAWSGGDAWKSEKLVSTLTQFVHDGGMFLGIGEPSAVEGYSTFFRMAHVLGVDEDTGIYACHATWNYEPEDAPIHLVPESMPAQDHIRLTDPDTQVWLERDGMPQCTMHPFGKGCGVYMSGFAVTPESTRMLLDLLCLASKDAGTYLSDTWKVETAFYPASRVLAAVNETGETVTANVDLGEKKLTVSLNPYEMKTIQI